MPAFATTRWSLILDAREAPETARRALEQICRDYRGPVLSYVRRAGHSPSDAEDLTQEFFARFLERRWHARADPARGRFRNYLLTALRRFLIDAHDHDAARKRGGGQFTADLDAAGAHLAAPASDSPEQAFTRQWMDTVLAHAMRALREEQRAAGKLERFEQLAGFIAEPPDPSAYRALGESLGIRANTLAVTVHRLRQRLRELVREELLQTLADPEALEEEWRALRETVAQDFP